MDVVRQRQALDYRMRERARPRHPVYREPCGKRFGGRHALDTLAFRPLGTLKSAASDVRVTGQRVARKRHVRRAAQLRDAIAANLESAAVCRHDPVFIGNALAAVVTRPARLTSIARERNEPVASHAVEPIGGATEASFLEGVNHHGPSVIRDIPQVKPFRDARKTVLDCR